MRRRTSGCRQSRAGHLGPQVPTNMDIRLKSAGPRLRLEPQRMAGPTRDPIVHIGAEAKLPSCPAVVHLQLNGRKRRIFHHDAAFFYRRDKEISFTLTLEDGSEQF